MTTAAATAQDVLEAYRDALTRADYDALSELYAEDAVQTAYSERNRPGSAQTQEGRDAIIALYREAPAELKHEVSDPIVTGDGFALVLTCIYPSGEKVVGSYICQVRDGKIAHQVGVEAWDE